MKISEMMTTRVELIDPDASVQQAAIAMAEHDVGAVLVGTAETLLGILTDRDVIIRVVVEARDAAAIPVREVMSSTLYTCRPEDTLDQVFSEMRERQVRRLPVLDEANKLVGIVTLSDLANKGDQTQLVEQLRAVAEPHRLEQEPTMAPPLEGGALEADGANAGRS